MRLLHHRQPLTLLLPLLLLGGMAPLPVVAQEEGEEDMEEESGESGETSEEEEDWGHEQSVGDEEEPAAAAAPVAGHEGEPDGAAEEQGEQDGEHPGGQKRAPEVSGSQGAVAQQGAPARPPVRGAVEVDIPPAPAFYPEDEPQLEQKQLVERLLGLYLVHPPWRHHAERVELVGREVRVTCWYSIAPEPETVGCDALRWLSRGRNQWSGGAADVFDELEGFDRLTLSFVNVEKRPRVDKADVQGSAFRYLAATISRDTVGEIAPTNVEDVLQSGKCLEFLKKVFKPFLFDLAYYEKELQRGLDAK